MTDPIETPLAPAIGDLCTFTTALFAAGQQTAILLGVHDQDPDCVLYDFEVQGKILSVRREAIKYWNVRPQTLAPLSNLGMIAPGSTTEVQNPGSFTEFLFDQVFKMKERGDITAEDPVYRFAKKFYQSLGWPVSGDDKRQFREFITHKLFRECFDYPGPALQELIEMKNYDLMRELLQKELDTFTARLPELMYVLDIAWDDYKKTTGFRNADSVIGSAA